MYLEIKKGVSVVGYMELDSYSNVTGNILTPYEASLMIDIDALRIKENG